MLYAVVEELTHCLNPLGLEDHVTPQISPQHICGGLWED